MLFQVREVNSYKYLIFQYNIMTVSTMENNDIVNNGDATSSIFIYTVVGWIAFVVALFAFVVFTMIKCLKKVSANRFNHHR